jgi:hypothetical protein
MCKPSSHSVGVGCIQFKRPFFLETYAYFFRFFLDTTPPRKLLTAFSLE